MTKLEEAIEHVKKLPAKEQEVLADWILAGRSKEIFEFTPEESAEIDRRLANIGKTKTAEEVFAKYGL